MEEIKNKISEIEQEMQNLYYEGYTDNSPEIKAKQAEMSKLYAKLKPEKDKPRVDKEQIKIKNEISEIEQEIQMLYYEGYTDNSPEINEKKAEIKELHAKIKPTKENSNPKDDKEQIKIKNEISEIEQEIQMLYHEGYTDNSPEIKEKQAKIKELYAKVKTSKENDQSKMNKEQLEIQNKIFEIEQEIQILYYEGYTDNSPEIKAKQEEIKKLYSKMKEPSKNTEQKKETVVKPQTTPAPEQSSDTSANQSNLSTIEESRLEKVSDSIEGFLIGVAESKPVEFIKGIFSKLADSRLGRFFGKVFSGIKSFGQSVVDKVQNFRKEKGNIEPEIDDSYIIDDIEPEIHNDDYVFDDLEPDIKENIVRDVEKIMGPVEKEDIERVDGDILEVKINESIMEEVRKAKSKGSIDESEDIVKKPSFMDRFRNKTNEDIIVEKEDFIDRKLKQRNEDAKNGKDRYRRKNGNKIIIDESGKEIIVEKVNYENPWIVKQEDLNVEPVSTKPKKENSHENDGCTR